MDGERISLRLEQEDLAVLDRFIEGHPEFSNRSHLARLAIREFIDQREEPKDAPTATKLPKETMVTVELPALAYKAIVQSVRAGVFNSTEDAVIDCLRREFITKDVMDIIRRQQLESMQANVQVLDR